MQDAHVLDVRPVAVRGAQGVVRPAERERGKQLFPVAIAGERPGLAHQRPDDVAVVDPVLGRAVEAGHPLDQVALVVHLDHVGMLADLDGMADEARRHRVGASPDADGAPAAHVGLPARVARDGSGRERAQLRALGRERRRDRLIAAPVDHRVEERRVGLEGREVGAPAQHERLRERDLGPVIGLLGHPVFVRLPRPDPGGRHAVVVEHRREAGRERAAAAALELVRRRRQVIRPQHGRDASERPQRPLQAGHQGLERLAKRDRHPAPATRAQHELEQQVAQQRAGDRHAELGGVGEIDGPLPPRRVDLLEVHLLARAMERPPVPHTALERPQLARPVPGPVPLGHHVEHGRRLEHAGVVRGEERDDLLLPHAGKRIRACPPAPRRLARRGQRAPRPRPSRPDAHPRGSRRGLLGLPLHTLLPQQPDLRVRDHPPLPRGGPSHAPSGRRQPAKVIVVDRQK